MPDSMYPLLDDAVSSLVFNYLVVQVDEDLDTDASDFEMSDGEVSVYASSEDEFEMVEDSSADEDES